MENDEVSMAFGTQTITKSGWEEAIQYSPVVNPAFCVTIKNKTNKTIYIDLGNTFFSRGGEAQPYYIPGETHQYKGGTTGASVNMGAVAGALGVGGALGTLANGVNKAMKKKGGITLKLFTFFVAVGKHYANAKDKVLAHVCRIKKRNRFLDFLAGHKGVVVFLAGGSLEVCGVPIVR